MTDNDPTLQPIPTRLALLLLLGPLSLLLAGLLAVGLVQGGAAVGFLFGAASVSVLTGAGKFVVLGGLAADAPIGPLGLAILVIAMDTAAAFMLIPVMPLVYRTPLLGKHLRRVRGASQQVLQRNRWMRRFTFGGLVTYVAVPLGGTGAIGAVFLGRLLGMQRVSIVAGTFIGAVIGALTIFGVAWLGEDYVDALQSSPLITTVVIVGLVLAATTVIWRSLNGLRARRQRALVPPVTTASGDSQAEQPAVESKQAAEAGGNGRGDHHPVSEQFDEPTPLPPSDPDGNSGADAAT